MNDLDSLRLALDAEKYNHRKDSEYLLAQRDRLDAALTLAVEAFAQYAEETNHPSQEAIDGYRDGFLQEAHRRSVVAALSDSTQT